MAHTHIAVSTFKPPIICWEKLPKDYTLPDEPMDNFSQPLLAEALREALSQANLTSPTQLIATNFGISATVEGYPIVKAPDWMYVLRTVPIPAGEERSTYTPHVDGDVPSIVMEFISENQRGEYSKIPTPPYGKWFFYEQILEVPVYVIFNPSKGTLEVYHLKAGLYQAQVPTDDGRYWIAPLNLYLGVWYGTKKETYRTGYWLRWWDASDQLLLWGGERFQETEKVVQEALEEAKKAKVQAKKAKVQAQQAEADKQAALAKVEQAEKTVILRIVRHMLQAHIDLNFIIQVTGLSEMDIRKLNDNY